MECPFTRTSGPALGPTESLSSYSVLFFREMKRPEYEAHHFYQLQKLRMSEAVTPRHPYTFMTYGLGTGTTLTFQSYVSA